MIFSVQRFVEDSLERSGVQDDGRYSVTCASVYSSFRGIESDEQLLRRMSHIRTTSFKNSPQVSRGAFEKRLLQSLDRRFKLSETADGFAESFVKAERRRLQNLPRRTISVVLLSFWRATQGRTVDAFWISRVANKLQKRPETIAQSLLTQYILGVNLGRAGQVFREVVSGTGFVDLTVMFGAIAHLVELKVQTKQFTGPAQLENYMVTEGRRVGWLIVFDARRPADKTPIPSLIRSQTGRINVIVVDINPVAPSRAK